MKRLLLSVLFVACCFISNAQNATLTKKETIDYIRKKLKENVGMIETELKSRVIKITDADISMSDNNVRVVYYTSQIIKATDEVIDRNWIEMNFNPALVSYVDTMRASSPDIEKLYLRFKNNSVRYKVPGPSEWTSDSAIIPYPKGDGTYGEKLKKAFMHLIALLKAEDDPFQKP